MMGKTIKIILLIILICVVLLVGGCSVILGIMNHRNDNYWKHTETKGEIETKYTALGAYEVSTAEWNADGKAWQKYEVWYPSELKEGNGKRHRRQGFAVSGSFQAFGFVGLYLCGQ